MKKLEENGYAYLQSALDHSLEKIFYNEITDFMRNGSGLIILQVWNISLFPWPMHVI